MSTFNPELYGRAKPKKQVSTTLSSASSIALSSELARLASTTTTRGRKRPGPSSKTDELFKKGSNKGVSSRAARDLDQKTTSKDIGFTEDAELRRARKKMEEKTRLYNAMKRGDYVPPTKKARNNGWNDDDKVGGLIDFDRKWAEGEEDGQKEESSEDDNDSEAEDDNEEVEFTDEFGRTRKVTKKELRKNERQDQRRGPYQPAVDEEDRAYPEAPRNIIIGDTIQAQAFDEDDFARRQYAMEIEAKKEENTHYDANWEIRTKGVGFYQFSKDEEVRKKEMEALTAERLKTERERNEREARKAARRKEIDERRQELRKRKQGKEAENWLNGLLQETGQGSGAKENSEGE